MKTQAGSFFIQEWMSEDDEEGNFGAHSCKATLLAWLARAGVDREDRRILGYHRDPKDKSVDIYSRDDMSGPLRKLVDVLKKVEIFNFDPDATRSGVFAAEQAEHTDKNKKFISPFATRKEQQTTEPEPVVVADPAEDTDSTSSSGDDSDEGEAPESKTRKENYLQAVARAPEIQGGLMASQAQGLLHKRGVRSCVAACGVVISATNLLTFQNFPAEGDWELCKRFKCFEALNDLQ